MLGLFTIVFLVFAECVMHFLRNGRRFFSCLFIFNNGSLFLSSCHKSRKSNKHNGT